MLSVVTAPQPRRSLWLCIDKAKSRHNDGKECLPSAKSALVDFQVFDVETGFDRTLLDLNPDGWIPGVTNERNWVMLYGLGVCQERSLIAAGDSHGFVHMVDARAEKPLGRHQIHRKGNKVRSEYNSDI